MTYRTLRAIFLLTIVIARAVNAAEWSCSATQDADGAACLSVADAEQPAPPPSGAVEAQAPVEPPPPPRKSFVLVDPAEQDWMSRAELAPSAHEGMPAYCPGMYVEPEYPQPLSIDPSTQSVRASGSELTYWIDDRAELSGDVRITQGNRSITTPLATLNVKGERASFGRGAILREPGFAVSARSAEADLSTGAAELEEASFLMHANHLRGSAATVTKDDVGNVTLTDGFFTRCEPGNNSWRITSDRVQIDKDAVFGTAHNAVVRVRNVPVLYAPRIQFPVSDERVSGFLLPDLGYSEEYGVDIGAPYYFNLAPNYDATVTGRYVAKRGAGMEAEFRHMEDWEDTTIGAAFLYDDDLYDGRFERDEFEELNRPGEFETENRWLLTMLHDGRLGAVHSFVDYGAVSDNDYFGDLGTELDVKSRVDLQRTGGIEWQRDGFSARFWGQRFQNLDPARPEPYQRLPEIALRDANDLGPFSWSLAGTWSDFYRKAENFGGLDRIVGNRSHVEPRFALPFTAPWGFAALTTAFQYTMYDLDRVPVGVDESPEREIWMGSADAGVYLERELSAFGAAIVQTLEPRVYYLYQDFTDQSTLPNFDASALTFTFDQLFRENRFSGVDRIGDANQTSVGVTSRFLDAESGREYLRASVGQIIYFEDRRVTIAGAPTDADASSRSSFAGELQASLLNTLSLRTTTIWDGEESEFDEVSFGVQYLHDNRHIFNVGYRRVPEDPAAGQPSRIDQSDIAIYWPVAARWSFIGRWNYDLDLGRSIETVAGIEYSDCCWQFRVVVQQTLENTDELNLQSLKEETNVHLQIVFRGLAGVGNKVNALMEDGIQGYVADIDR